MNEIWRPVTYKRFKHYMISNLGRVYNLRTDKEVNGHKINPASDLLYLHLYSGKYSKRVGIHKLVALAFNRMSNTDETAYHLNYIQDDNRSRNLKGSSRAEAQGRTRRRKAVLAGKIPGVYPWQDKCNPNSKPRWRVMFSIGKMKLKTFGYCKTREEAIELYKKEYTKYYGINPLEG